jgi:hypothetical protein
MFSGELSELNQSQFVTGYQPGHDPRFLRRFVPVDFVHQRDSHEKAEVVTKCDHLSRLKFSKTLPYDFSEHSALMAAPARLPSP